MHEWQMLYEEAVVETDDERLKAKVDALETAIFLRLQELATNGDGNHHSERIAIEQAATTLRRLQTERLHFPPLPKETKTLEST